MSDEDTTSQDPEAEEPETDGAGDDDAESGVSDTSEPDGEPESAAPDPAPEQDEEPSDPSMDGMLPIRSRIAQSFRDGGPVEAGAELTSTLLGPLREIALPLGTLIGLLIILITFRAVLLPFILACALVYLMEPVVGFIGRRPGKEKGLPRWLAVIFVYLSFIVVITVSLVFIVPTFVSEIVRFAEEAPEEVQEFRSQQLPEFNRSAQEFLRNYLPVRQDDEKVTTGTFDIAQVAVASARKIAATQATALGNAKATVRYAYDVNVGWTMLPPKEEGGESVQTISVSPPGYPRPALTLDEALASTGWVYGQSKEGIFIEPGRDGAMRVNLNGVAIEVEEVSEKSWLIRQKDPGSVPVREESVGIDELFNLERRLDQVIEELVSTSNDRLASVIEYAQRFVVGIIGAFVGLMLTLMVAAFMSIDLPRVMAFLRSLIPRKMRGGYDILLEQLDTGLAGVVRGQLLICCVNGILTWVGLAIMDVKFSVLLAVVAGILSLIPVFGTILSTIPIVIVALTDGLMLGVGALGWILFIHALEANLLNPKIIGSSAHIHPVIVIFALLAGESAYGLVGALLAVPTASILLTLFNFVRTKAWKQAHERS